MTDAQTTDTSAEAVERVICNPIIAMVNTGRSPSLDGCGAIIDVARSLVADRDALAAELDAANARRNALSKTILKFKDCLLNTVDGLEDEGDRVHFGSSNDADKLRDIAQRFEEHSWDELLGHAQQYDFPARVAELTAENTRLKDLTADLRQQAEAHAQEARTQRSTVHEIYQIISGGTGEPGDWNGAEPVREYVARMDAIINTPETEDFIRGVAIEAEHQRQRWPEDHDASKNGFDWFWVVGFLSQKAATAFEQKDADKTLHHCISTAALMMNMHRHALQKFKGDQK